ncbi:hypothetical protein HZH66_010530 [Vespula vulgaris]|uniref:Nucleic-acid-binding protein from mobile element jockey n=1 Tax=Vespula vulgaris TaxID=7454 RepID=A0A834JFN8_VESVU|nr:hypothetical protein HZH66_010530 [Vespula vulgaris]
MVKKKRDIPQSMRCQAYGHTRNYCNRNPACVKCADKHLMYNCPLEGKLGNAKCFNCQGNHPASYKGCISYADALSSETKSLFPNQNNDTYNEISEIKQLLIQSAKSLELIRNMLIEQNKLFQQQIQQINAMIQLLTKVIANNNNKNG